MGGSKRLLGGADSAGKKRKQSPMFYIMHEQGGTSRRTKLNQINRRSEALMMWHKCNTKHTGKICSLSFCLPGHRGHRDLN